jgi:hypothetical protein
MSHNQTLCPTNKVFHFRVSDRCTVISTSVVLNSHSWQPPAQFAELRSSNFGSHTIVWPYVGVESSGVLFVSLLTSFSPEYLSVDSSGAVISYFAR